jgi:3'(2'), 5'-bisphosphate nucleotidase
VVGSRNHLSQATLDYLARFGDMARGEIELVSMGSSLKFCIIAEGAPSFTAPRPHLRVGYGCGAGGAGRGGRQRHPARWLAACYNKPDILNPWFVAKA